MLTRLVAGAGLAVAGYLAVALALVASSAPPRAAGPAEGGLDFAAALAADLDGLPPRLTYAARDGTVLPYRRYPSSAAAGGRALVLVHGSGWHGMQFHTMAQTIAGRGLADVVVPDLRGHGATPQRRGDVDHVGQLEEDLADLIAMLRERGAGPVVLGGHSSGGGLVVRFAGGAEGGAADAFVLMAPFLRHDAPTTRPNSGGWARPAVRRIVGLSMLNAVGITALDHLPVIGFAMPRAVLDGPLGDTATTAYSHRLNVSFAPRADYASDLAALDRPFLLLAGTDDEAFFAARYEQTIAPHTDAGTYRLLPGVGHLGLVGDPAAIDALAGWLAALPAGER